MKTTEKITVFVLLSFCCFGIVWLNFVNESRSRLLIHIQKRIDDLEYRLERSARTTIIMTNSPIVITNGQRFSGYDYWWNPEDTNTLLGKMRAYADRKELQESNRIRQEIEWAKRWETNSPYDDPYQETRWALPSYNEEHDKRTEQIKAHLRELSREWIRTNTQWKSFDIER